MRRIATVLVFLVGMLVPALGVSPAASAASGPPTAVGIAAASGHGTALSIDRKTSSIFLEYPCTVCDFPVPAVRVTITFRCTPGLYYVDEPTFSQDGTAFDEPEGPLGAGEGRLCMPDGRLTFSTTFVGEGLHAGKALVTDTVYVSDPFGSLGAVAATASQTVRIPQH